MRTILLNPGPVTLSDGVRNALGGPDLCHREPEFATLQDALRRKLLAVYDCDPKTWAAILLTGSGTAAVEAMLLSCVPADARVLVLENGVYGERMSRILAAGNIPHDIISAAWDAPINTEELEARLNGGGYSHVALVHHETTTGRLNALAPVATLCNRYGTRMLLDAVSSFGAEAIEVKDLPLDAMAATANKCLHGVPGTAFVIARRDNLAAAPAPPRSVYLDLGAYLKAQDRQGTPFTQSIQTFYALNAALDEFFAAGGRAARHELFTARMATIRATLAQLGVTTLLEDGASSCVLHAFRLPPGQHYEALHDALKTQGFIIYAGQGALSSQVFRISAMGDISPADLERLCAALSSIIGGA